MPIWPTIAINVLFIVVEAALMPVLRGKTKSLLQEMSLFFFHGGMTEVGKWEHRIGRDRIDNEGRGSSFSSFRIGWRQYKPSRYFEMFYLKKLLVAFFVSCGVDWEKSPNFTLEN